MIAGAAAAMFASRLRALPLAEIKLGITTDEIDDDVLTAARFLRDHGLKWAEVRNIWGPYNTAQPMEKVREAMSILDANGVRVSIEGTGFFKVPLPPETPEGQKKLDEQWKLLDASLERLGVDHVDLAAAQQRGIIVAHVVEQAGHVAKSRGCGRRERFPGRGRDSCRHRRLVDDVRRSDSGVLLHA